MDLAGQWPQHDLPAQGAADVGRQNQRQGQCQPAPIYVAQNGYELLPGKAGVAPTVEYVSDRGQHRGDSEHGPEVLLFQSFTDAPLGPLEFSSARCYPSTDRM